MILVVGGAGFLGSHVASLLGSSCVVYDNLTYRDEFLNDVRFVYGDVTDYDHLGKCLDDANTVVWLAAIVGDAACNISPGKATEVNVDAVKFLAERFNGKIIFTSTASVYGRHDGLADENTAFNPQSLYAETKVRAEDALKDKDALILRLGTLHGLSDRMRFDLVVNAMTRDAVEKDTVTVFGGKQSRPLIHVREVAEHIRMWTAGYTPGTYNFASENVTINEVAERVAGQVPGSEIVSRASEFEDGRDYSMNCCKLGELDQTVHTTFIEESVVEIADALRSRRIRSPYDYKYVNVKVVQGWISQN